MMAVNSKNQCFVIWSNEIDGRLDAYYYSSEFQKLKTLRTIKTIEFEDLIEIITKGETPLWRGDSYLPSGIPFLKVQNISEEGIVGDVVYISEKVHNRMKRSQLFGGELLYTMAGRIGTATILPDNFGKTNINQAIAKIILKKGVNKKYIKHILNSDFCKLQAEKFLTTSAQPNINFEQIKSIKIPLPSPEAQNQIVELMQSAYKQKVEKEQKAEKLLNSIDDYVLEELGIKIPVLKDKECFVVDSKEIKERVDPYYYQPKFKELYKAIERYKKVYCLKDIVEDLDYGLMPTQDYALTEKEGVPMIRVTNILQNGTIDMSDVKYIRFNTPRLDLKRVKESDILIVQCGSTTGKAAIVPKEYENYTFGSFSFVIRGKKEIVNQYYLWAILSNRLTQEQIRHTWNIVTVRPNTSKPNVENLLIPVPPLEIQNKIAEEVKNRIEKTQRLKSEAQNIIENAKKEVEKIILGKSL